MSVISGPTFKSINQAFSEKTQFEIKKKIINLKYLWS